MATSSEFAAVMAYLGAAVGKEPTEQQCEVYFDLLGHFDVDLLRQAVRRAVHEHKISTIPPVGVIAAHARDLTQPPLATADAWEKVCTFAVRWSCWLQDGLPTHQATLDRFNAEAAVLPTQALAAARSYGWRTILETDPGVAFAQFRGIFEAMSNRERTEAMLPPTARLPKEVAGIINGIGQIAKSGT